MTHFPVVVVLPSDTLFDQASITNALEEVLDPFNEDGEWFKEGSKWDWWVLGGRWMGTFVPMNGAQTLSGVPGTFDNDPEHPMGVDAIRVGDIDWEAMDALRRVQAKKSWDELQERGDPFKDAAGQTEEEYINSWTRFRPHAFLYEGKWEEPGEMGWWGAGGDAKKSEDWVKRWEAFVAYVPRDSIFCLVDCHV